MAEQFIVDRLETSYPKAGFTTKLGRVTPFYGLPGREHVVVNGNQWLTPQEARDAAAALLTAADLLENRQVTEPIRGER